MKSINNSIYYMVHIPLRNTVRAPSAIDFKPVTVTPSISQFPDSRGHPHSLLLSLIHERLELRECGVEITESTRIDNPILEREPLLHNLLRQIHPLDRPHDHVLLDRPTVALEGVVEVVDVEL